MGPSSWCCQNGARDQPVWCCLSALSWQDRMLFKADLEIISVNKVKGKPILIKMKENGFY